MKKLGFCILILESFLMTACDRTVPVEIKNETKDTITIKAIANYCYDNSNSLVDYKESYNDDNTMNIHFRLPPKVTVTCGMAIMGIEKDLPFDKLKVYMKNDSIIANTRKEVLNLFEKRRSGNYTIPYQIVIK